MISQLKESNKICLLIKNLKKIKKNKKLNYINIISFFIRAKNESISYKLKLFSNS